MLRVVLCIDSTLEHFVTLLALIEGERLHHDTFVFGVEVDLKPPADFSVMFFV